MKPFHIIDIANTKYSKLALLSVAIALEIGIGIANYYTGTNFSFALFHAVTIAFVTWFIAPAAGYSLTVIVVGIWLWNIHLWSHSWLPSAWPIVLWSVFERAGIFGFIVWVIGYARKSYDARLHFAEDQYTRIVETAMEGIVEVDDRFIIRFVNSRAAAMLGAARSEIPGKDFQSYIMDEENLLLLRGILFQQDNPSQGIEICLRTNDGQALWTLIGANTFTSRLTAERRIILVLMDITARKHSEEELQRKYKQISAIQQMWTALVQSVDIENRLQFALEAVLEMTRFEAGCIYLLDAETHKLILRRYRGFSPEFVASVAVWKPGAGITGTVAESGRAAFIDDASADAMFMTTPGESENIRGFAAIPLFAKDVVVGVMNIVMRKAYTFLPEEKNLLQTFGKQIGISLENSQLYHSIRNSEREIRKLTQDLVLLQEDERRRFARELHDGLSQVLTSLRISADLAAQNLLGNKGESEKRIKEVQHIAEEAQIEAKRIAYDLRPPILDDFGLIAALKVLGTNFERRTMISVEMDLPHNNIRFDQRIESNMFRIVQECLTNAGKHSGASAVVIELILRGETLAMSYSDNGKGFDVETWRAGKVRGSGFRNINDRVTVLGGTCSVESSLGRGTEIAIELPLDQTERDTSQGKQGAWTGPLKIFGF